MENQEKNVNAYGKEKERLTVKAGNDVRLWKMDGHAKVYYVDSEKVAHDYFNATTFNEYNAEVGLLCKEGWTAEYFTVMADADRFKKIVLVEPDGKIYVLRHKDGNGRFMHYTSNGAPTIYPEQADTFSTIEHASKFYSMALNRPDWEIVTLEQANKDFMAYHARKLDKYVAESKQIIDALPLLKPLPKTQAALMAERTEKSQYNRMLKMIRKQADAGKKYYGRVILTDYTIELLTAEGFKLTKVEHSTFVMYEIRW